MAIGDRLLIYYLNFLFLTSFSYRFFQYVPAELLDQMKRHGLRIQWKARGGGVINSVDLCIHNIFNDFSSNANNMPAMKYPYLLGPKYYQRVGFAVDLTESVSLVKELKKKNGGRDPTFSELIVAINESELTDMKKDQRKGALRSAVYRAGVLDEKYVLGPPFLAAKKNPKDFNRQYPYITFGPLQFTTAVETSEPSAKKADELARPTATDAKKADVKDASTRPTDVIVRPYSYQYSGPTHRPIILLNDEGEEIIYTPEKYQELVDRESETAVQPTYMSQHPQIKASVRGHMANWMVNTCDDFGVSRKTLHLAVNLLDQSLSATYGLRARDIKLTLTALIWIAAKHEEYNPPPVQNLAYKCGYDVLEVRIRVSAVCICLACSCEFTFCLICFSLIICHHRFLQQKSSF